MIKCSYCNVAIDSQHKNCPLCDKRLKNEGSSKTVYPSYQKSYQQIKAFTIYKLYLFLTIAAVIISITINLLTIETHVPLWSVIVTVTLLYVWITVRSTFLSKTHIGGKILIQFLSSSVLVVIYDIYGSFSKWSTNYAIPFLIVLSIMVITIIAIAKKSFTDDYDNYMGYLLATFFISLCPIVLFIFNLATVLWTSVIAFIYSLLTIIGLFVFSDKKFKEETKKRFHF
jgi:hypothetical protein